jgi:hypothetical protein
MPANSLASVPPPLANSMRSSLSRAPKPADDLRHGLTAQLTVRPGASSTSRHDGIGAS